MHKNWLVTFTKKSQIGPYDIGQVVTTKEPALALLELSKRSTAPYMLLNQQEISFETAKLHQDHWEEINGKYER